MNNNLNTIDNLLISFHAIRCAIISFNRDTDWVIDSFIGNWTKNRIIDENYIFLSFIFILYNLFRLYKRWTLCIMLLVCIKYIFTCFIIQFAINGLLTIFWSFAWLVLYISLITWMDRPGLISILSYKFANNYIYSYCF